MGHPVNKLAQHELIRPAEYARRRGVTRAAVSKAILRCRIPLIDGKLDPLVADTLWRARTDPEQQRRALLQNYTDADQPAAGNEQSSTQIQPPGNADNDYYAIRRRQALADARMAELNLQEREGKLVSADEVEKAARRLASDVVQQLDAIPDRIAAECGIDDEQRRKIRHRMREELDRVRAIFARAGALVAA
jgi:hypothetical protein